MRISNYSLLRRILRRSFAVCFSAAVVSVAQAVENNVMNAKKYVVTSRIDGFKDSYHLHDAGAGSDCLVHLHGHNANGDQPFAREEIAAQLRPLVKKYNLSIFSPNLRNNAWMSPAAVADLRDMLLELKAKRKYKRFFFICASMGGTGGLIFASQHPELVSGLAVLGAATDLPRYREYLLKYHKETGRDIFLEIAQAIKNNHTEKSLEEYSVCKNFEKLTMPLVFYHGIEDYVMPVTEMYALQQKMVNFPNAEFKAVPGPHNAPVEFREEVFEKIYHYQAPAKVKNDLEIIIPVSLESDWKSCEETAAAIMEQYRLYGFTNFALAMPDKGWRSRHYPPESFFAGQAEKLLKVKKLLPPFIRCGWWHTLILKSGPTPGLTRIMRLNGTESPFSTCPLDPEYRRRFAKDVATVLKTAKPAFMITEDDFSLNCHGGPGCYCKHHLEAFAKKEGRYYSREELEKLFTQTPEQSRELLRRYQESLKDSLVQFASAIREAADAVAPEIPIGFMQPGNHAKDGNSAEAVARALAGKNHTPFIRFNGTFYGGESIPGIPSRLFNCLYYKQHIKGPMKFLHESDTYPHTRFFTSSCSMRVLMAGVYSMGYAGSTFQTQQILDDPNEEKAFGKMFAAERKRFNSLHKQAAGGSVQGVKLHHDPFEAANFPKNGPDWALPLSYMSIPYTTDKSDVAFISGNQLRYADDKTIKDYLSKGLFLDGLAAKVLCERGYGKYLGVRVADEPLIQGNDKFDLEAREIIRTEFLTGRKGRNMPRGDVFSPYGNGTVHKLEITDSKCETVTDIVNSMKEVMAPGMTRFANALGGKVVVYATDVSGNASHSLFNYRRQALLQDLIVWCSDSIVFARHEPRIFLIVNSFPEKSGKTGLITCISLGADPLDKLELHLPAKWRKGCSFKIMDHAGRWQKAPVEMTADGVIINSQICYTQPVYLLIEK